MPASLRLPLRVIVLASAMCIASGRLHSQGARQDSAGAVATVARFHEALAAQDSVRALSLLASDVLVLESGAIQTRATSATTSVPT
jgi:hypothetical protein